MSQTTLDQLGFLAYQELTKEIDKLADLEELSAHAEADYKRERAKAFMASDGSMAYRDAQADDATADSLLRRRLAEAKVRIQRERVRAMHARIEVGRTIASTERRIVTVAS